MSGFGGGFGGFGQSNTQQQSTPAFGSGFGSSNTPGRSPHLFAPLYTCLARAVSTRRELLESHGTQLESITYPHLPSG